MELASLPDGGLVQATDQFVVSRAGAARRVSGSRFALSDASGNSVLTGDPRLALGAKLRAGTAPLLSGDGATTAIYSGTGSLAIRNAADTATNVSINNADGSVGVRGGINSLGAITQNGQQVYHTGNFNPSAYVQSLGPTLGGDVKIDGAASRLMFLDRNVPGDVTHAWSMYATGDVLRFFNAQSGQEAFAFSPNGSLNALGPIMQNGQQVYHTGNFNPATKQDALGFTPYSAANPAGYISGITGGMVSAALGYTPYSSANPAGYISGITSSMVVGALGYTPANAAGQTFTGNIRAPRLNIDDTMLLGKDGANPTLTMDDNDAIIYERANNKFVFIIGGNRVMSIDGTGTLRVSGDVIGDVAV